MTGGWYTGSPQEGTPLGAPPGFQPPVPSDRPLAAGGRVAGNGRVLAVLLLVGALVAGGYVAFRASVPGTHVSQIGGGAEVGLLTPSPLQPVRPTTFRGSGSSTLSIAKPESRKPALLHVTGNAAGESFVVLAVDDRGRMRDIVVNTFERYDGVRLLDMRPGRDTTTLRITATGPWTVEVRPLSAAPRFDKAYRGNGDAAVYYTGPEATARVTGNSAHELFTVFVDRGLGHDVLANSLAPFDGTADLAKGPVLIEVRATGPWSITAR